ncbi:cellular apoptosis susceptibility/chromosome segregation 1-like protein [Perkinsela sp. CCAP 1560/4]|nr:cellular apoptosis susceptibility/chromosome segregation 1-like protein [Perkinsela sp. CCAP 1560/4]|eukprot:KNH04449.1 cellular apoptosis susceptibility/chromosome segregation 1-like protein [Perkinsela sp. CCAP 1560/4]
MDQVAGLLKETLSPTDRVRKGAEAELTRRRDSPSERSQLHRCLFDVICTHSFEAGVRHAAAIFLQNLIKLQWSSESDSQLVEEEKEIFRTSVLHLLYNDDRKIRDAVSCCISRIAEHDFPLKWPEVLPFLNAKFQERNCKVISITFTAIISLLGVLEPNTPLNPKAIPSLAQLHPVIENILSGLEQAAAEAQLSTAILGTELFGHLCRLNLIDDITSELPRWMKTLHTFLQHPESAASSQLKKVVLEGLNLFLFKYSDEFAPYKEHFISLVWKMLCEAQEDTDDALRIAGMDFFTSVAKSARFWETFAQESTLQLLCEQIIIPNVLMRPDEVELIREDFAEYIRVDIEGNNVDTRRRAACNLAVALISGRLERLGKPVVSSVIRSLLQVAYSNSSLHWREMDAAVCLILSLSVSNDSKSLNNAFIPDAFCNLGELYQNFVLREIENPETSNLVLKADALKFICHFRFNLPSDVLFGILAHIRKWITHENNVIAIYAAHCVDQIFMMDKTRNTIPNENVVLLTQAIVEALEGRSSFEVDRLAKSLYHVVQVLREECQDINTRIINLASTQLQRGMSEPLNSFYLHFLLDSLGFITSERNFREVHVRFFDLSLTILQQNIDYLVPYALQIISKCAWVSHGRYEQPVVLLSPVLNPEFCRNKRYVAAVVLFVSTVFTRYPIEQTSAYIEPTLEFFDHLMFVKPLDHEGFFLISALIDALPSEMFVSTLHRALSTIFRRLNSSKTNKFVKNLILWLSRCILVSHTHPEGPGRVIRCIEQIQAGCFETLFRSVWLSSLERIVEQDDRELVVTAMAVLLLTDEDLLPNRALWKDSFTELCRLVQKNRAPLSAQRPNERANREIVAVGSRTLLSCAFQRETLLRQDSAAFFSERCKAFAESASPAVNEVLNELSSPVKEFVSQMNK